MTVKEMLTNLTENSTSMCFGFYTNLAAVLVGVSNSLLKQSAPQTEYYKALIEPIKKPCVEDFICVLNGNDFGRWTMLTVQLQGFLKWYEQKEADEFFEWESFETLVKAWNEYAMIKNSKE